MRAGAAVLERIWMGQWPRPLGRLVRFLTNKRSERWETAEDEWREAALRRVPNQAVLDELANARNKIALARPRHPTWMGDRVAAVDARLFSEYALDLRTIWPRIWLTVPETSRSELTSSRGCFDSATALAAWGLLYALVGIWWWPAAVAGVIIFGTGWFRGRDAIAVFADLVEASVDLYAPELAVALGIETSSTSIRLTKELGEALNRICGKGA